MTTEGAAVQIATLGQATPVALAASELARYLAQILLDGHGRGFGSCYRTLRARRAGLLVPGQVGRRLRWDPSA